MEILDMETMKQHDAEFKLMTRKFGQNSRIDLFKVVAGKDQILKSFLGSYKEGRDYLMNEYTNEYKAFQKFVAALSIVVKSKMHLFDFEAPEWRVSTDSSMRHIVFDYEGESVTVEVCVVITTGYNRVTEAKTDWLQVLHNDKLDAILERFVEEAFLLFDNLFSEALVS